MTTESSHKGRSNTLCLRCPAVNQDRTRPAGDYICWVLVMSPLECSDAVGWGTSRASGRVLILWVGWQVGHLDMFWCCWLGDKAGIHLDFKRLVSRICNSIFMNKRGRNLREMAKPARQPLEVKSKLIDRPSNVLHLDCHALLAA